MHTTPTLLFTLYILFASSLLTLGQAASNCSQPAKDTCTFYTDCLEAKYHCGPDGYPIGYGFHFCTKFSESQSKLSSDGQSWLSNTMLCLQSALVPDATNQSGASATCDALKSKAFATHADCYVDSGLCSLPVGDWEKISVEIVGPGTLVESLDALKATLHVAGDCTKFFAFLVKEKIGSLWPFKMKRERADAFWLD